MKNLLILLAIVLVGCATTQLDQRVAKLEAQIEEFRDEALMDAAAEVGATKMYGRTALIGGTASVDNILESGLLDGDLCTVIDSNNYRYFYRWDANNNNTTNPQSVPNVIEPETSDGTGAWILSKRSYSESFYSAAADGDHYVDPSNTSSLPSSPPQGAISVKDNSNTLYIADSDGNWWPLGFGTQAYTTSQDPLPYVLHWGGNITNYGAVTLIQLTLEKAELGMEVNFYIGTNNQAIRINPDDLDKFIGAGFTDGEYYWADGLGEYITIKAVKNGAGATDVDWAITNIGGVWVQES